MEVAEDVVEEIVEAEDDAMEETTEDVVVLIDQEETDAQAEDVVKVLEITEVIDVVEVMIALEHVLEEVMEETEINLNLKQLILDQNAQDVKPFC